SLKDMVKSINCGVYEEKFNIQNVISFLFTIGDTGDRLDGAVACPRLVPSPHDARSRRSP
ncbi:MAG: hypothetical protein ACKO3W_15200, partial [bacterium]